MKKIVVLLLIPIMLLVGCGQSQEAESTAKWEPPLGIDTIYDMQWASEWGYYQKDVLPDEEVAKAVAQKIFDSIKADHKARGYKLQHATYYEEENAWMVFFANPLKKSELSWLGGGCTIALSKADGQVLRIFWW